MHNALRQAERSIQARPLSCLSKLSCVLQTESMARELRRPILPWCIHRPKLCVHSQGHELCRPIASVHPQVQTVCALAAPCFAAHIVAALVDVHRCLLHHKAYDSVPSPPLLVLPATAGHKLGWHSCRGKCASADRGVGGAPTPGHRHADPARGRH